MRVFHDFFKYVGNRDFLENTAVDVPGKKPEPRPKNGPVAGVAAFYAAECKIAHQPVEITGPPVGQANQNRHRFAQQLVGVDVVLHAEQIGHVFERPADFFRAESCRSKSGL